MVSINHGLLLLRSCTSAYFHCYMMTSHYGLRRPRLWIRVWQMQQSGAVAFLDFDFNKPDRKEQ